MGEARQAAESSEVPASARWFVRVFLAVFVVCALFGINAWPFSGWRLFSQVRPPHVSWWQARAVDGQGLERPLPFSKLPVALRGFALLMREFPSLLEPRQEAMCEDWARAARAAGIPAASVNLYRVEQDLVPRDGERPAHPPVSTLAYACGAGTVQVLGTEAADAAV